MLVTAVGARGAEIFLSGPIFSKAGDFVEKVPACRLLKNKTKSGDLNCKTHDLI